MTSDPLQQRLHQVPDGAGPALLAVVADFIGLPGAPGTLAFYGPATTQYQAFVAGEPHAEGPRAEDPHAGEPEVLGMTRSHSFLLVVGQDGADLAVQAASIMQDDVMDELSGLWPELTTPSAAVTVLQPLISDSGRAQWQSGEFTCPIGELRQTFGHLIRRT